MVIDISNKKLLENGSSMSAHKSGSTLPQVFTRLQAITDRVRSGVKGEDFLVLEDGDEMKGYEPTELEEEYENIVEMITSYMDTRSAPVVAKQPEVITTIIGSLVGVQPAVDAYRARMLRYATDWGSEVSPIGNWSRILYNSIRPIVDSMSIGDRRILFNALPDGIRRASIQYVYWTQPDTHDSYSLSIRTMLLG